MGRLTVRVGNSTCGVIRLDDRAARNSVGNLVVSPGRGLSSTAACTADGAKIEFYDENGNKLLTEFTVRAGARMLLSNLGPEPAHTGKSARLQTRTFASHIDYNPAWLWEFGCGSYCQVQTKALFSDQVA